MQLSKRFPESNACEESSTNVVVEKKMRTVSDFRGTGRQRDTETDKHRMASVFVWSLKSFHDFAFICLSNISERAGGSGSAVQATTLSMHSC